MTDNITPEFLAKMHAALRDVKHNAAQKHGGKQKVAIASSSVASTSASPVAAGNTTASPKVDTSLADSVAQTTAGTSANIADGGKDAPPKAEAPKSGEAMEDRLIDEVLASEIHEVETSILHPLLERAVPPPIEDGVFEIKDTHGQIIQRTPYVKGKIQGEVQFFDVQGNIVQTYKCVEGVKQGSMRYFDARGVLTCEVPYAKDKREGMGTFYVNGIKMAEITFHEDTMEGPAVYYASDGYVTAAVLYHNNALQGEMRCFDPQQRLVKTISYLKGQLNGESITYYPGGAKVFERMHYLENVPVDKQIQFYEDGSVLSFREYDKGKLVKEKFYDTKGKEIPKVQGEKITNLFPNIPGWKQSS